MVTINALTLKARRLEPGILDVHLYDLTVEETEMSMIIIAEKLHVPDIREFSGFCLLEVQAEFDFDENALKNVSVELTAERPAWMIAYDDWAKLPEYASDLQPSISPMRKVADIAAVFAPTESCCVAESADKFYFFYEYTSG